MVGGITLLGWENGRRTASAAAATEARAVFRQVATARRAARSPREHPTASFRRARPILSATTPHLGGIATRCSTLIVRPVEGLSRGPAGGSGHFHT